jgi:hypothetical protein
MLRKTGAAATGGSRAVHAALLSGKHPTNQNKQTNNKQTIKQSKEGGRNTQAGEEACQGR